MWLGIIVLPCILRQLLGQEVILFLILFASLKLDLADRLQNFSYQFLRSGKRCGGLLLYTRVSGPMQRYLITGVASFWHLAFSSHAIICTLVLSSWSPWSMRGPSVWTLSDQLLFFDQISSSSVPAPCLVDKVGVLLGCVPLVRKSVPVVCCVSSLLGNGVVVLLGTYCNEPSR